MKTSLMIFLKKRLIPAIAFMALTGLNVNQAVSQTAFPNPVCYGEPIHLFCTLQGCDSPDATFYWTNTSGTWTSAEKDPVIYPGAAGYATDNFILTVNYSPPPGGFSGGTVHVDVLPDLPPMIACPDNITVPRDPGICGAVVNYSTPVGTDNCPGANTSQTAGLASGSVFPVGTTQNTFMVVDIHGNIALCSFDVTVTDQPFNWTITNIEVISGTYAPWGKNQFLHINAAGLVNISEKNVETEIMQTASKYLLHCQKEEIMNAVFDNYFFGLNNLYDGFLEDGSGVKMKIETLVNGIPIEKTVELKNFSKPEVNAIIQVINTTLNGTGIQLYYNELN